MACDNVNRELARLIAKEDLGLKTYKMQKLTDANKALKKETTC